MISVSCFEVGFCESNVCFRGVIVVPCDKRLDKRRDKRLDKRLKIEGSYR